MIIGYETRVIEKHLSAQQTALLGFLRDAKTAAAAAEHLGIEVDSVYPYLRLLQRLNLVEKCGYLKNPTGAGKIALFRATGRPPLIDRPYMSDPDQIKAHDPFGRCA